MEIFGGDNIILCSTDCIPDCDFCIHCIHEMYLVPQHPEYGICCGEPVGCTKHEELRTCDDFECVRCEETGIRIKGLKLDEENKKKIETSV